MSHDQSLELHTFELELSTWIRMEMTESNGDDATKASSETHSKKRRIPGACDICKRKKGTSRDHSRLFCE